MMIGRSHPRAQPAPWQPCRKNTRNAIHDRALGGRIGRPDARRWLEPIRASVDAWSHDLYWTLVNKIRTLPDTMVVLPAHYASPAEVRPDGVVAGLLGDIRRNNPALALESEAGFIAFIKANMRPQPAIYAEIRQVNLGLVTACEAQRTAQELGKNQCAASAGRKASESSTPAPTPGGLA